jgi:hypothetical protein
MDPSDRLKVGVEVVYDTDATCVGVVVQIVDDEYVRILWDTARVPTTHRQSCLQKAEVVESS